MARRNFGVTGILLSAAFALQNSYFSDAFAETVSIDRTIPAEFGLAPDNNLSLLLKVIDSAQQELVINIYQLDSKVIADAIIAKIKKGVRVRLLVEGEPVGRMSNKGKIALREIKAAMTETQSVGHELFIMKKPLNGEKRRFVFNHAKYVIADQRTSLISSENFGDTGHPVPGKTGNRGWEIVLHDDRFSQELTELFAIDADPQSSDVFDQLNIELDIDLIARPTYSDRSVEEKKSRTLPALPYNEGSVSSAKLVTSPGAEEPIEALLGSAKKNIELEFMSLPTFWKKGSLRPLNPIVHQLIERSKNQVVTRVIVNDDRVFDRSSKDEEDGKSSRYANFETAQYINEVADCYGLILGARVVDIKALDITYIHNKGISVDDQRVLVSSINGTQNSVTKNREVAVQIESRDAARYYGEAFDLDWTKTLDPQTVREIAYRSGKVTKFFDCDRRTHPYSEDFMLPEVLFEGIEIFQ